YVPPGMRRRPPQCRCASIITQSRSVGSRVAISVASLPTHDSAFRPTPPPPTPGVLGTLLRRRHPRRAPSAAVGGIRRSPRSAKKTSGELPGQRRIRFFLAYFRFSLLYRSQIITPPLLKVRSRAPKWRNGGAIWEAM